MMGPAVGIGLYCHCDPGGIHPMLQAEGHHQTIRRPILFPSDWNRGGSKQVLAIVCPTLKEKGRKKARPEPGFWFGGSGREAKAPPAQSVAPPARIELTTNP